VKFLLAGVATLAVGVVLYVEGGESATSCGTIERGVLPEWARTGFSEPEPRMPHVLGENGRIVAILFEEPLIAEREQKILWVAREPLNEPSDLNITAERDETVVTRKVAGGPGPSGIELPGAGCWTFDLRWAGQSDRLRLAYRSGDPG
jgi:hypothetical protein